MTRFAIRSALAAIGFVLAAAPPLNAAQAPGALRVERIETTRYPVVRAIIEPPAEVDSASVAGGISVRDGAFDVDTKVEALPIRELAVVLVVDTSGSMQGPAIATAQRAASGFVAQLPSSARIAVVGFGSTPRIYSPFTNDRKKTNNAIKGLSVRGETALHDALITASSLFGSIDLPKNAQRSVILLTDGGDTVSKASLADAARSLTTESITLSAVAMNTRESDEVSLKVLASSVGGAVISAADLDALERVFAGLADSMQRKYQVTWRARSNEATDVVLTLRSGGSTWIATDRVSYPAREPVVTRRAPPAPSGPWLVIGILTGFGAILLGLSVFFWPRAARRRRATELIGVTRQHEMSGVTQGLIESTRRAMRRRNRGQHLGALLERAGTTVDAPSATVLAGAFALIGLVVGVVLSGLLVGIALAALFVLSAYLYLKIRADRRSAKFRSQFDVALQTIIDSLKSGYGISQALDTVARETDSPVCDEFRRVRAESTLGMDQIRSLEACAKRMDCEELLWTTECMEVNRDVGGNLAEVLTGVANTVRSRGRLRRQIHAISSEGRLSSKILTVMPFVALLLQATLNRDALRVLFTGSRPFMLVVGLIWMCVGFLWMRRIVDVEL